LEDSEIDEMVAGGIIFQPQRPNALAANEPNGVASTQRPSETNTERASSRGAPSTPRRQS
jgi:hypothetical protein